MSSENVGQYREIAVQIVQRAEKDESFAKQAKANPVGTLTEAGIPADVAQNMVKGGGDEVGGYMKSQCRDTTCWVSACPGTCFVTIEGDLFGNT